MDYSAMTPSEVVRSVNQIALADALKGLVGQWIAKECDILASDDEQAECKRKAASYGDTRVYVMRGDWHIIERSRELMYNTLHAAAIVLDVGDETLQGWLDSFVPVRTQGASAAEHIFNWARTDSFLYNQLNAAHAYSDGGNFSTARASMFSTVATKALQDMRRCREQVQDYTALDVLKAAVLLAEWDGES